MGAVRSIISYCLECTICHIMYVGQTKNRILDTFHGHLSSIRNHKHTAVAKHFASHGRPVSIHHTYSGIHKHVQDIPRSKSLRDKRQLIWIYRLNTLIINALDITDLDVEPQKSKSGLNKLYLACLVNMV